MKIVFVWSQFAPYNIDRLDAIAQARPHDTIIGIEIASKSNTYAWAEANEGHHFEKITLFAGGVFDEVHWRHRRRALTAKLSALRPDVAFLANYNNPDILLSSTFARARGVRVYTMQDSKFDDKPRNLWGEFGKSLFYLPYNGALVSGPRSAEYLRFLGFRGRPVALGYDTVSLSRLRRLGGEPAPGGPPFPDRDFVVVARFVEKKNLPVLLRAYAQYKAATVKPPRRLRLCGDGPLRGALVALAAELGLQDDVVFEGFLQEEAIAQVLGHGLACVLPSTEEQWGLAINEALAFHLPIICSDNVGARDLLVRQGVNGFVVEPTSEAGWAAALRTIAESEAEWTKMVQGSAALAPSADTSAFVQGVTQLVQPQS